MLRFLSADWLRAFDAALRADDGLGARFATNPIAIAQEVVDPSDPNDPIDVVVTRYVIVLDGTGGRVETDQTEPREQSDRSDPGATVPDVTFVCDRATAADLARGTVNAQRALTTGRLKLRGEVDRLAAASGALAGLGDLLAGVRAQTEF